MCRGFLQPVNLVRKCQKSSFVLLSGESNQERRRWTAKPLLIQKIKEKFSLFQYMECIALLAKFEALLGCICVPISTDDQVEHTLNSSDVQNEEKHLRMRSGLGANGYISFKNCEYGTCKNVAGLFTSGLTELNTDAILGGSMEAMVRMQRSNV